MNKMITDYTVGTYNEFDVVVYNNITYQVKQGVSTTSSLPGSSQDWAEVSYGNQYESDKIYNRGDTVVYNGNIYIVGSDSITGEIPSISNSYLEVADTESIGGDRDFVTDFDNIYLS